MNKICTSLEQSKKLIELGIDISTADMFYAELSIDGNIKHNLYPLESYGFKTFSDTKTHESKRLSFIPAWSLSALIWLMPERIKIGEELSFCLASKKSSTGFSFGYNLNGSTFVKDNPIDAAFEMVVWLKENGKL